MATTQQQAVFTFGQRPCIVLGEAVKQRKVRKFGSYTVVRVRFIDGLEPRQGLIARGKWGQQGHVLKGPQADFWRRVDDLVEHDGFTAEDARTKAMAELGQAATG